MTFNTGSGCHLDSIDRLCFKQGENKKLAAVDFLYINLNYKKEAASLQESEVNIDESLQV